MTPNYVRFLIAMFFFLSACAPDKKESNEKLKKEVIAIHDEVMPKMDELKKLKKEITQKSNDLAANGSGTPEEIGRLNSIAAELDDSFEEMFVWMRQFKSSYEELTQEEIEVYLQDQKIKVQEVNDHIKSSIAAANKELGYN
jgi:transposase-like protein